MKPTLFRFFFRRVATATLLTWLGLVGLLALFDMLNLAADYPFLRALALMLFRSPEFAIETLPFACAFGATISVYKMVNDNEMAVLRNAGLSPFSIIKLNSAAVAIFLCFYVFISELILPAGAAAERVLSNDLRSLHGLWLRDGENYAHVDRLFPDGRMESIVIYGSRAGRLREILTARRARFTDDRWMLKGVETFTNQDGQLLRRYDEERPWDSLALRPSTFSAFSQKPRKLSTHEAWRLASELSSAGQNDKSVRGIIWQRLLTLPAICLLAAGSVWFVGSRRQHSIFLSLSVALLMSGGFYFIRNISVQAALLADAPYLLPLPLLLLAVWVALGARRG